MTEQEQKKDTFSVLSPREKRIIDLIFGLDDGIFHTDSQLAKEFKISERRIRFIEKKALRKLKRAGEVPPAPGSQRIK